MASFLTDPIQKENVCIALVDQRNGTALTPAIGSFSGIDACKVYECEVSALSGVEIQDKSKLTV